MAEKKKLTTEEKERVKAQIAELQASIAEEADAETPDEEKIAAEEVEKKKAKLAALFDRLGLTEEDYDLLIESVGAGLDAQVRHIVKEELGEEGDGGEKPDEGTVKELVEDPNAPPVESPPDTAPENTPESRHWTEKKVFGKDEPEEA